MKPFDVFSWQPAGWPEPHPCVIVSHPSRVKHKPDVEVLMCSTKQTTRPAEPGEVILDSADGLDWPTICKCDLVRAVKKTELKCRRGAVSPMRQLQIIQTIVAAHGWGEIVDS